MTSQRARLPRLAKTDVDYTEDPFTFIDEEDFTDDEMKERKKESDDEEPASDEDVPYEREESEDEDEDEDSIVVPDHESEPRRSQTCEESVETDLGSEFDSD